MSTAGLAAASQEVFGMAMALIYLVEALRRDPPIEGAGTFLKSSIDWIGMNDFALASCLSAYSMVRACFLESRGAAAVIVAA